MKLFIDDKRQAPEGWTCVRSVARAKILIDLLDFETISCDGSLDYDKDGGGIEIMKEMETIGRKYLKCPLTSNKLD